MDSNNRTQAEIRFAAIQKRQQAILKEKNVAMLASRKKTARLKALRLRSTEIVSTD